MKKVILLLIVMLSVVFVSCQADSDEITQEQEVQKVESISAKQVLSDFIKVTKYETSDLTSRKPDYQFQVGGCTYLSTYNAGNDTYNAPVLQGCTCQLSQWNPVTEQYEHATGPHDCG